ncbi:WD40-repeat-containing domain protein [Phlyctochytrium arcticum]|nr:WD40-repeat-containing domain protein [Phlyctochytrium arcticum]
MNKDNRASKIYDFVAHDAATTCLRIGPKSGRVMVTGGEDRKVNLWTIGKTTPILSLGGHATSIECVTLDWPEEIVVAGSSAGTIKLWDLEHAKVIRTLPGHKAAAKCVEFHPFGEFFASGSADSSIKIWDVRRKGCIQTYHGHHGAITTLRITPDGRWIATGGTDSCVKLWDMTAGKLLHSYSDHTEAVTTLAFNPSEFLMVTGGADNTLRFYDLQTFECISSTPTAAGKPEALQFDPEGHEVYAAFSDSLQIWTWEPAICHESIAVSWPNITDLRVMLEEGKVLGGTIEQNFVSMWGIDINPRLSPTDKAPESPVKGYSQPGYPKMDPPLGRADSHVEFERLSLAPGSEITPGSRSRPGSVTSREGSQSNLMEERMHLPTNQPPSSARSSGNGFSSHTQRPISSQGVESDAEPFRPPSRDRSGHNTPPRNLFSDRSHMAEQAALPTASSFVGAGTGDRPLNLDISKFVANTGARRPQPLPLIPPNLPAPRSDDDVIDSLCFRHASVTTILQTRLNNTRCVRQVWEEGNIRPAVETLVALKDPSVWVDVLRILNLKPRLLTLEVALSVLPALNELLFEVFEDYIVTACTTIRLLCRSFGPVILANLGSDNFNSTGVDITREERVQRCRIACGQFQSLLATLDELKRSAGKVGVIVRETVEELDVFRSVA